LRRIVSLPIVVMMVTQNSSDPEKLHCLGWWRDSSPSRCSVPSYPSVLTWAHAGSPQGLRLLTFRITSFSNALSTFSVAWVQFIFQSTLKSSANNYSIVYKMSIWM
jgi:hypothetical protein